MPSKILRVSVADGERVESGALLLTLESMKMETAVRAQRGGVVSVRVRAGDVVSAGALLAEIKDQ